MHPQEVLLSGLALSSFAQRQYAAEHRTNWQAPCDSCHQPAGNQAAAAQVESAAPESSWFDGIDFEGTGAELNGLDLVNVGVDTGMQKGGNRFGTTAEASIARLNEGLGIPGLEGAAGKLNAEATLGADGATLGLGATWAEAAYDNRWFDPDWGQVAEQRSGCTGVTATAMVERSAGPGSTLVSSRQTFRASCCAR